jgi:transcriptional regulator with XRE-family HTH domain
MRNRLTPADLRLRAGLTQEDVAKVLKTTSNAVSKWERFDKSPRLSFAKVKLFMRAYQCSLDDLIECFDRVDPDEV